MATKEALLAVQKCLDINERNITKIIAQRQARERASMNMLSSPVKKDSNLGDSTNDPTTATTTTAANALIDVKGNSNKVTNNTEQIALERRKSWARVAAEKQRKSSARKTERMDGGATAETTSKLDRSDSDRIEKTTFESDWSLSRPPFPTSTVTSPGTVSTNSPPQSSQPVRLSSQTAKQKAQKNKQQRSFRYDDERYEATTTNTQAEVSRASLSTRPFDSNNSSPPLFPPVVQIMRHKALKIKQRSIRDDGELNEKTNSQAASSFASPRPVSPNIFSPSSQPVYHSTTILRDQSIPKALVHKGSKTRPSVSLKQFNG